MPTTSPFLTPGPATSHNALALLSLKRDQTIPVYLQGPTASNPTDAITNTRFGSYPHSTLLNLPWGVQVIASNVGARERKRGKKRKHPDQDAADEEIDDEGELEPVFEAAASGFAHILPPTPEGWTVSLPHRTQVVYTPDYSYILQRLRARPGDRLIEAGAGSGSFTHAAVRAVFNGYPDGKPGSGEGLGKVFSFEYHEPRYESLVKEIREHGLEDLVRTTHRDVYKDGFKVEREPGGQNVTAVFLDLPAPWLALPHLTRKDGPLHTERAVSLCSFSPCIEQAQRAASTLRELGWINVGMAAMSHRRIDVRRERIGLQEEGLRGVNAVPASVDEAIGRLRQIKGTQTRYHENRRRKLDEDKRKLANGAAENLENGGDTAMADTEPGKNADAHKSRGGSASKLQRRRNNLEAAKGRKLYKEGRLVHRTEPELKTHTSYLVFALLAPNWSEEDEAQCEAEFTSKSNQGITNEAHEKLKSRSI